MTLNILSFKKPNWVLTHFKAQELGFSLLLRLDVIPELGFSNNIDALSYEHNNSSHQHHAPDLPGTVL